MAFTGLTALFDTQFNYVHFFPAVGQSGCSFFFTSGRKESNGTWTWAATGKPFGYTDWGPNQPDNWKLYEDVMEFRSQNGEYRWNDRNAGRKCCSLCEFP